MILSHVRSYSSHGLLFLVVSGPTTACIFPEHSHNSPYRSLRPDFDRGREGTVSSGSGDADVEGSSEDVGPSVTFLNDDALLGVASAELSVGTGWTVGCCPRSGPGAVVGDFVRDTVCQPGGRDSIHCRLHPIPDGYDGLGPFAPDVLGTQVRNRVVERVVEDSVNLVELRTLVVGTDVLVIPELQIRDGQRNERNGECDRSEQDELTPGRSAGGHAYHTRSVTSPLAVSTVVSPVGTSSGSG